MEKNPWLSHWTARTDAKLRLFCFPYAGAGGAIYRDWAKSLPAHIDVCPIEPPGRFARSKEKQPRSMSEFIDGIERGLDDMLDLPFACFGYSLGALMAFEWARSLRRRRGIEPTCMVVAASRAPHVPARLPPISHLPASEFLRRVQQRYGAFDRVIQEDPELLQLVGKIMQVDLEVLERYECGGEAPFTCPFTAIGGTDDPGAKREDLDAWGSHTVGGCDVRMVDGDHFFIRTRGQELLDAVRSAVQAPGAA
ncbi:thioesterase domain-containing protein [Sorangium sp. So ce834]|uniref:thioesterase II family protein n=1 Tax=Sorangium sp. So ce834 TaxID=3133321 RepID=UPI003F5E2901